MTEKERIIKEIKQISLDFLKITGNSVGKIEISGNADRGMAVIVFVSESRNEKTGEVVIHRRPV